MKQRIATLALAALALAMACRDPTEITIHVFTNLGCPGQPGETLVQTTIIAGANKVATTQCTPGSPNSEVGTLVVVPGEQMTPIHISVVGTSSASASTNPDACIGNTKNSAGCIVTTRSLAFVPHRSLEVPIVIDSRCAGVDCGPNNTCVAGSCVSQCLDPSCTPPDDGGSGDVDGATPIAAIDVSAHDDGTCIIVGVERSVECFGTDTGGRFTGASKLTNVRHVALGTDFGCALMTDDSVVCWGDNTLGQLGDGTRVSTKTPVIVALPPPASLVVAGRHHACALAKGEVYCWGDNTSHQVHGAAQNPQPSPFKVATSTNSLSYEALAAGDAHTCAIGNDASQTVVEGVFCWGANPAAGTGVSGLVDGPTLVKNPDGTSTSSMIEIACGEAFTSASDGVTALAWGDNANGQADPSQTASQIPPKALPHAFVTGALGGTFGCSYEGSKVTCWGDNTDGQLGPTATAGHGPFTFDFPDAIGGMALGTSQGCVIVGAIGHPLDAAPPTTQVWCWGRGYGAPGQVR